MHTTLNTTDTISAISDSEIALQNDSVQHIVNDLQHDFHHRVASALKSHPHVVDRHLRFEVANGRVVLSGRVQSYFHKQMAQEALRSIHGVHEIENQLEVAWE